jgi:O-antigen ligase
MLKKERLVAAADWLAAGIVLSLPWSTSATSVLTLVWLIVVIPTLDRQYLRECLSEPAAIMPIALWFLAFGGIFWSQAPWSETLEGFRTFHKLLMIPLLMIHFSRSPNGSWLLGAFLVSSVALLLYSWASVIWPGLVWPGSAGLGRSPGVPVKDSIYQSIFFVICACTLLHLAISWHQEKQHTYVVICVVLIVLLLANITYVGISRTALVVLLILSLLIGYQRFGVRGAGALALVVLLCGGAAWVTSSYFRIRVTAAVEGTLRYQPSLDASEAERIQFWTKSLASMREAPLIGHGTGSIRGIFEKQQKGTEGAAGVVVGNPHNQVFAIGIQLGVLGIAVLFLMWLSHLLLFRGTGLVAWLGTMIVVQNIVASMFNSHLSDFTAGWGYVLGVGALGGMVLRQRSQPACHAQPIASAAVAPFTAGPLR